MSRRIQRAAPVPAAPSTPRGNGDDIVAARAVLSGVGTVA